MKPERKFLALRIIATIYNILAAVFLVSAIMGIFVVLFTSRDWKVALGVIFVGTMAVIAAKSIADIIMVFLSIEENTRKTTMLAEEIHTMASEMGAIAENTRATALVLHHMNKSE